VKTRRYSEAQGEDFDRKSEEEIAEEIVRDVTVGVDDTGICSGIIGEVGGSWPLQEREKKSLRASARAQKLTGAPITLHTGRNEGSPRTSAVIGQVASRLKDKKGVVESNPYPFSNILIRTY